jgi:hypothetical protein
MEISEGSVLFLVSLPTMQCWPKPPCGAQDKNDDSPIVKGVKRPIAGE